jgi:hypothetical protein
MVTLMRYQLKHTLPVLWRRIVSAGSSTGQPLSSNSTASAWGRMS